MDEFASRRYPVQEHMLFQQRMWVVQRIGWVVLAAICLAALSGLFGSGFLSDRTVQNATMTIQYQRFERATRLAQFSFHFAPTESTERRLRISRNFQDKFEIRNIQPRPLRSVSGSDGLELTFAAAPLVASHVTIWARPHAYGSLTIETHVDDGPPSNFSIFVYP
jgi:hypothetical protein